MGTVGVIGAGRMGRAVAVTIATATAEPTLVCSGRSSGRPVELPQLCTAATLDEVLDSCRIAVLALPFPVAVALLSGSAGRRGDGRTLIDTTNPGLCPRSIVPSPWRSGGELLAAIAPGWHVAKAFNAVAAEQMSACRLDNGRVAVPVAGMPCARAEAAELASRLGFEPLDVGGIEGSRELESLARLLVLVSSAHGMHGQIGIRIGRPQRPSTVRGAPA
jgi:8-hydroxy-5-deazaflavin:NADPH oxidoreductase